MEVVVIGNGVAGEAVCSAIRSTTEDVGITLISEEPHPFYSPCLLAQYIAKEVKRSKVYLKSPRDYEKERISALLGHRVKRIDPTQKLVFLSDRKITYDRLILATGSQPIIPPMEGIQKKGVRVLKSIADGDRLLRSHGKRVIIVGSGPIGVELGVAFRKRNWEVCLIEVLDWILPNLFDEKGASWVRKILEDNGIKVLTGERVMAIDGKVHVKGVLTDKTGRVEGDMVVLAIGMRPNTELARQAKIEIGDLGGIRTNDRMETSVKDIYACGDCVEGKDPITLKQKLSLLWPQAERQGRVAGYNCIGEHRSVRWMPDVINLEVFGTLVGAMGTPARLAGQSGTQWVERVGKKHYRCLVISKERLVGAQFVGDYEGMGVLFSLLGRNFEEMCRQLKCEENVARIPWYSSARSLFLSRL